MRMSLRRQIALWYVVAMPILIFGLVFTARHIMVASMHTSLDDRLQGYADMVAGTITANSDNSSQSYTVAVRSLLKEESPVMPRLTRLADPSGNTLMTFGKIPDSLAQSLDHQWHLPGVGYGRFDTVEVTEGHDLRIYTIAVTDPANLQTLALVQVGDSLDEVTAAQNRLLLYTLLEAIIGSMITVLVGLLILRRGFRPLDRILGHVQEVESSNLQAGLPKEPRPPELQQLADSLDTMWRRLAQTMKERESFVAAVSHDLRTPLSALQGQLDILLMQSSLDSATKENLKKMHREVRRLIGMTNNLLLNAQLEAKPSLTPTPVNLRVLLEEIAGEMAPLARGLGIALQVSDDVVISGDYDLLKQMVLNVVDNAIKFTPKGGLVELALGQEDGWAVVEVSDTGKGISQEHLPYVMEPFYRANTSGRSSKEGAGLGLAIVKQVVQLHDGQIEIQSQEGIGTKVKIRLPIVPAANK